MHKGRAALVHHLGLLLRIKVLCDQPDDADQLALPVFKPRRALFDQIEQVLLGQPELALDFLQPRFGGVRVFLVTARGRDSPPQIVVGRLGVGLPFLGPALLLGEVGLGAVGVAVDAVILERVRRVEHPFDRLDPVPLLAFRHIVAGKAQIIEDPVGVGPLPEQVVVLEEVVMPEGGMRHDQGLHGHGIFFHDVADARVGIDDDFVGQALEPACRYMVS